MVELASYSSVDWSDSVFNHDKAEALKSNSPKARLLPDVVACLEGSRQLLLRLDNHF
jgi:hypothetical protein